MYLSICWLTLEQVYSKLDLKCGYHQLELTDKAREITTFATHKGNFRYKRLFFGPANGPEVYQKVMQDTLEGCEGVNNISDDIIVHGSSYEEHDERLDKVLQRLSEKGLTLNFNKCVFRMTKLIFVSHVLSAKGVGPAEEKVKAVREFREPKDVHEVKSFMGLGNFLSKHIPDLAPIAEPLWRVTRQKYQFVFGREQKAAFQEIKDSVSDAETLAYFKLGCKTTVVADASPVSLGAVLLQEHKGQHKVISYASYSLTDVEKRYSQTEKEALGLVWACERFKFYLLGIEFDLITDHKSLEVIFSPKLALQRSSSKSLTVVSMAVLAQILSLRSWSRLRISASNCMMVCLSAIVLVGQWLGAVGVGGVAPDILLRRSWS